MVVSASHFKDVTNGYEKRTDGLYVHTGRQVIRHNAPPMTNTGYQVGHLQLAQAAGGEPRVGFLEDGVAGTSLYKQAGGHGLRVRQLDGADYPVVGAPGSVSTAMLAVGAAQALIGSYLGVPSFSTVTTGQWVATPVTTGSIACTGAQLRIEGTTGVFHSVVGGAWYTGLLIDGAFYATLSLSYEHAVNATVMVSWTIYVGPAAGNHTFALAVHNIVAGTCSLAASINSSLYVTEQRR